MDLYPFGIQRLTNRRDDSKDAVESITVPEFAENTERPYCEYTTIEAEIKKKAVNVGPIDAVRKFGNLPDKSLSVMFFLISTPNFLRIRNFYGLFHRHKILHGA